MLRRRALSTTFAYAKGDGWKTPTAAMRKAVEEYFEATHSNTGLSMESVYLSRKITASVLVIDLIGQLDIPRLHKAEKGLMEIASEMPERLILDGQERKRSSGRGLG